MFFFKLNIIFFNRKIVWKFFKPYNMTGWFFWFPLYSNMFQLIKFKIKFKVDILFFCRFLYLTLRNLFRRVILLIHNICSVNDTLWIYCGWKSLSCPAGVSEEQTFLILPQPTIHIQNSLQCTANVSMAIMSKRMCHSTTCRHDQAARS